METKKEMIPGAAQNEDFVEAEIVEPRGRPYTRGSYYSADYSRTGISFFKKIKYFLFSAAALAGLALVVLGFILTSTLIGAIIGLPLIIAGAGLLWALFRFTFSGSSAGIRVVRF